MWINTFSIRQKCFKRIKFTNKMGCVKWAVHRKKCRNPGCKFYPPSVPSTTFACDIPDTPSITVFAIDISRSLSQAASPFSHRNAAAISQPGRVQWFPKVDESTIWRWSNRASFCNIWRKQPREKKREKKGREGGKKKRKGMNRMFLTEIWSCTYALWIERGNYLKCLFLCVSELCNDYSWHCFFTRKHKAKNEMYDARRFFHEMCCFYTSQWWLISVFSATKRGSF